MTSHGLSEHSSKWRELYTKEAKVLEKALGDTFIEIHHIGSTSVDKLIAKPLIDIALAVHDLDLSRQLLEEISYEFRGEFNIPFRYFFRKRQDELNVNLHVVEEGNPEMEGFLLFRDYMQNHPEAVAEYSTLKKSIADKLGHFQRGSVLNNYTLAKDKFIRNILKEAGFTGLCMRFVCHYNEQDFEKTVLQKVHFAIDPKDYRFVFYRGPEIIGYANVKPDGTINIIDTHDKYKTYFTEKIKAYTK